MKQVLRGIFLVCLMVLLVACGNIEVIVEKYPPISDLDETISIEEIPEYQTEPFVVLNDNMPGFSEEDDTKSSYEFYSDLDFLGRCGSAMANIGQDIMPTEDRGMIGQVKPSGWHTVKYDNIDGKYLYNRCHLIGFQLTGENANEQNLITGTRYMNVEGMLPFENSVAEYVRETGNHVLYRVTPVYEGNNLLASGVRMEAWSVEDNGAGICFHVYVYNVQPGIEIDYTTGESWYTEESESVSEGEEIYILNTSSKKFHKKDCGGVATMQEKNKEVFRGRRAELIEQGYGPCGSCNP